MDWGGLFFGVVNNLKRELEALKTRVLEADQSRGIFREDPKNISQVKVTFKITPPSGHIFHNTPAIYGFPWSWSLVLYLATGKGIFQYGDHDRSNDGGGEAEEAQRFKSPSRERKIHTSLL